MNLLPESRPVPTACLQAAYSALGRPDSELLGYLLFSLERMGARRSGCAKHCSAMHIFHLLLLFCASWCLGMRVQPRRAGCCWQALTWIRSHPRLFGCRRIFLSVVAKGLWGEAAVLLRTMLQPEHQAAARRQPSQEPQEQVVLRFSRRLGRLLLVAIPALDAISRQAAEGAGGSAAAQQARQLGAAAEEDLLLREASFLDLLDHMGKMPAVLPDQIDSWRAEQAIQVLGDDRLAQLLQSAAGAALRARQRLCGWGVAAGGAPQPQAGEGQAGERAEDWLAAPPPAEQLLLRAAEAQATRACANLACTCASGGSDASQRRGRRCAGCTLLRYCSAACQQADWPRHKATCRLLVRRGMAGG